MYTFIHMHAITISKEKREAMNLKDRRERVRTRDSLQRGKRKKKNVATISKATLGDLLTFAPAQKCPWVKALSLLSRTRSLGSLPF